MDDNSRSNTTKNRREKEKKGYGNEKSMEMK